MSHWGGNSSCRQFMNFTAVKSLLTWMLSCAFKEEIGDSENVTKWVKLLGFPGGSDSKESAWNVGCEVKSLSHVRLFATPWTVVYQAPPSMGFSRQEYWSGLPFPSPMHESEKWKSYSSWPHGLHPIRLLHPWDSPGKSTRVGCHCLLRKRLLELMSKLLAKLQNTR